MTIYSQGDVVLVPFPFTDQSGAKQRPAVVLSGAGWAYYRPLIWRKCAPFLPEFSM